MRDPKALISTGELAAMLGDPMLRLFDYTTSTVPPPEGYLDKPVHEDELLKSVRKILELAHEEA